MEGKEPSAGLVLTFGNEVGGIEAARVKTFFVFKGIVNLGIWHCAGVEPHIDEVGFAMHRLAGGAEEHDVVDVGAMEVDFFVVFL